MNLIYNRERELIEVYYTKYKAAYKMLLSFAHDTNEMFDWLDHIEHTNRVYDIKKRFLSNQ